MLFLLILLSHTSLVVVIVSAALWYSPLAINEVTIEPLTSRHSKRPGSFPILFNYEKDV
jgi:hypothetical protein